MRMRTGAQYRAFMDGVKSGGGGLSRKQEFAAWAFYGIEHGKTFLLRLLVLCSDAESYRGFLAALGRRWPAVRLSPAQDAAAKVFFAAGSARDRVELLNAFREYEDLWGTPLLRSDGTEYSRRRAS